MTKSGKGKASLPSGQTADISLGVLLFLPYRHLERSVLEVVVAAGHPISLAQARIFQRVDPAGIRLTTLAESAQVTKQTASTTIDELGRMGYVARVPDPSDGRARLIMVTDRGREVITIATREQIRIESEWHRHLGPRGWDELHRALTALREITDPYA